ncbi:unnamed protein product [Didymodactylos carnosus]|uniref:catechol O-methyltransferase n=1 Tax=Didymodactylos carnosus TaxID=1234261 RepID=A0A815E0X5_9BILA|nr:unnamed protein product [Didymodactylos carnosus]CAF1422226.1 unnamed protein product [Didymodactylos carnosus]CAF4133542.1 unnamed protein product [Didymodactylos carnosus]CAF4222563.1 unnamed protein product [Didymodactylos carnosus]
MKRTCLGGSNVSRYICTLYGYSALRIASYLPKDALFITVDSNQESAQIASEIFKQAGISDRVHSVVGSSQTVIPQIKDQHPISSFDFIFIDHSGENYLRDFKLLEYHNLITSGTMIVADNILYPGSPDYADYIRNNPNYSSKMYEASVEWPVGVKIKDGVEVSVRN